MTFFASQRVSGDNSYSGGSGEGQEKQCPASPNDFFASNQLICLHNVGQVTGYLWYLTIFLILAHNPGKPWKPDQIQRVDFCPSFQKVSDCKVWELVNNFKIFWYLLKISLYINTLYQYYIMVLYYYG